MSNTISISEVTIHRPDIENDKLAEIASEMADYYLPKNSNSSKNVPLLAKESDFEALEHPIKKVIKMSESRHIDDFFNDGSLQLATFEYYQQFENPEVGDKTEGSFILVGQNESITMFSMISGGLNNYIFCCYDGDPDPKLINDFEYDDYFEIVDVEGFMKAVGKKLNANIQKKSKCFYSQKKIILGKIKPNFNQFKISSDIINIVNKSKYFLKTSDYNHQNEYRFVWTVPEALDNKIVIKCPEAIKFCKRK